MVLMAMSDRQCLDIRLTQCNFVYPLMQCGLNGRALASVFVSCSSLGHETREPTGEFRRNCSSSREHSGRVDESGEGMQHVTLGVA